MTLCIIILIIFYLIEVIVSNKISIRAKKYNNSCRSNSKLQYDVSCDTIKAMGLEYRTFVSHMDINDFLQNDIYLKPDDMSDLEHKWICSVVELYSLKPSKDILLTIYGKDGIWYSTPTTYSKDYFIKWTKINTSQFSTQITSRKLKRIIELKCLILSDNYGNSYSSYKNNIAIDYVANKYNLPTNEEFEKLYGRPYESLANVCRVYMRRFAKQNNFAYIPMNMVCENPTEEQKQTQYQRLSDDELLSKEIKDQAKIMNKYDL